MTKRYREETEVDSINLANVLMLLARGGCEDAGRRSTSPSRVYECKTCSRRFPSFQALGGHRASHKKPKISGDDEQLGQATAKPKTHECSICGLVFEMGQALGGHMRKHRASAEGLICHGSAEKKLSNEKRDLLDLNLPPLEEEVENMKLGLGLGLGLGLVW